MRLGRKILTLCTAGTVTTSLSLVGLVALRSGKVWEIATRDIDTNSRTECTRVAEQLYQSMEVAHRAELEHVQAGLSLAARDVTKAGVSFGEEKVAWPAVNQLDQATTQVELPKMIVGGAWLEQNRDAGQPAPQVDEVSAAADGFCTIFQRMNDAGDMLRVCTSVVSPSGERAVGTYIPAKGADGSPNPVVTALLRGERYVGRAFVVDGWWTTGYEPIVDAQKNVVGAVFFGRPQNSLNSIRQHIVQMKIGKTGYVYVLQGKGKDRGTYIISAGGKRDGENIYDARDSDGNLFIRNVVEKALANKPGESTTVEYPWKNEGEAEAREKIAGVCYFAPWDWVIGVSAYKEEFSESAVEIMDALTSMMLICLASGVAISFALAVLSLYVSRRMTKPLLEVSRSLEDIATGEGDLTCRLQVNSADEVGDLCRWFNVFMEKL